MVSITIEPSLSGKPCIRSAFPKVGRPTTSARSWSCSAPATSSEALAVPSFTSTTIGYCRSRRQKERRTTTLSFTSGLRPREVYTVAPAGRKLPATRVASETMPPPLSRRSSTRRCIPACSSRRSAAARSSAARSLAKVVTRT